LLLLPIRFARCLKLKLTGRLSGIAGGFYINKNPTPPAADKPPTAEGTLLFHNKIPKPR